MNEQQQQQLFRSIEQFRPIKNIACISQNKMIPFYYYQHCRIRKKKIKNKKKRTKSKSTMKLRKRQGLCTTDDQTDTSKKVCFCSSQCFFFCCSVFSSAQTEFIMLLLQSVFVSLKITHSEREKENKNDGVLLVFLSFLFFILSSIEFYFSFIHLFYFFLFARASL